MPVQFEDIGKRLRAYRLGRNFRAEDVADRIGISRAAVYRLEKGELVKIETLESVARLLDVSLPSLLGVGVEYYDSAIAFFERMRQLEENVVRVLGNFSPFSFLLVSDAYIDVLDVALSEAVPRARKPAPRIDHAKVLEILRERRVAAAARGTPVLSVVGVREIERFLRFGLVGRFDLSDAVVAERRRAARAEIERLAGMMEHSRAAGVGVLEATSPAQTFQVFESPETTWVTISPYRLGDSPNISTGIAMVTSAPEAVRLFTDTIMAQWNAAHKGADGARILRDILASMPT